MQGGLERDEGKGKKNSKAEPAFLLRAGLASHPLLRHGYEWMRRKRRPFHISAQTVATETSPRSMV
jgi:hypothetical protein